MEAVKRRKLNESKLNNREETTSPLKVLLIASQPLVDDDQNGNFPLHLPDLKEERNKIQHIFANSGVAVKLHVIAEATFSEVAFALQKKWDIIHFTGHGTQEGASLLLEDGYGKAQHLLKDQLKILAESNASLIFLSACYSENFGAHLVVNDIERAVITIKTDFPIAQDAAIVFAENFYRGLAQGHVVQSAFAVAKQAVAMHPYLCTFENGVQKGTKQMAEKGFPVTDDSDDQRTPYSERFVLLGNSQLHLRKCSVGPCISTGINGKVEGNLVPVKRTMLGRESEIVQIVKSFEKDKSPRVSLYGTGGIGRTELSKAVAWWFVERGRLDTVLFVSASPAEGDHIISDLVSFLFSIVRVFGLPISEGTQLEGIKTAVLRYLADKRSLVIIDQWDMISSKPNLWNFILSLPPNVKVAITSNTPMNPSEVQNIEVMPLSSMNSRKLFWNIIKNAGYFQHRSTLDAQEIMVISNIGDALGGIPLAIEVAASQATRLSLPEIWKRLTSTPHMILETKNDITGTNRGVWTSLGLAFGVLPDAEKDLLTQLSIFQSPFSLDDVVSILDISAIVHTDNPIRDVLNSLLSLISHSFITDCRSVYAMNPVIRQFALYHLKREAVPLHYNAVRHFASSKTLEGMTPISEHLHAVSSYYEQEKASKLFLLYFSALHEEWITQGKWYKTIPIAQKALEAAKKLQDDQWIVYINCCLGDLYTKIGEVAEAHKIFSALAEPGEKMKSPYGVAVAKFYLGILSWTSGDIKAGEIQVQESIDIATVHYLPKRLADATATMGVFAEMFGRLEEARTLQQEGIRIREGLLEYENETVIYSKNIMALLAGSQSASEVDDLFSKSLNLVLNSGLWRGIIDSMARLSMIEHALGNQDKALEMIHYALNIATSRKYEMGVFTLLSKLGSVRLSEKNYKEAQKLFEQSLQKVKKIGSSWETVHTQVSLAMAHAKLGQIPTATELLEEVIELAERIGYKQGLFRALTTLATMDFEANNFILALPVFKECLKIKEVTSKKDEATTCAYVGKCYLAENLLKKARKYLSRSLTAYDQAGSATLPEREEIRILLDSCQGAY